MEHYKISQSPSKTKKPELKNFFIAKGQTKLINRSSVVGAVSGAIVILAIGFLFAAIRLRDQVQPLHGSLPPLAQHTATPASKGNYIYVITAGAISDVNKAVSSKNASLLGSYYASQVHVTDIKSGINETLGPSGAANVINNGISGATDPWDFHVPASEIAGWQTGPYGSYFSGNDLVGVSSDGTVISIAFDNTGQIITVFIAPEGDLNSPPPANSGSTSGGDSGSTDVIPSSNDAID